MVLTEKEKLAISFWSGIVFIIISLPVTYKLINRLTISIANISILDDNNCPNINGVLLHGIIFAIIVRLMMNTDLPGVQK